MLERQSSVLSPERQRPRDVLSDEEKLEVARELSRQLLSETDGNALEYEPSGAIGAKDSAHDVFFVRQGKHSKTAFACKRFRREKSAERELAGMAEAGRRGLNTLEPIGQGVYEVEDVGSILVTKQIPRFTTMNHLGWRDFSAGQPDYERRIARPLRDIGSFVGRMHANGVLHGDLQVKNIAQDYSGKFVLFDLEDAIFSSNETDEFRDFGKQVEDLETLTKSLVSRGYLWNANHNVFAAELAKNLFDPYLATSGITNPEIIDHIDRVTNEVSDLRWNLHRDFSSRIGLPS